MKYQVEYLIECLPEDTQIEGNVLASGNDAEDKRAEDYVRAELASGNEWAWCTVKVTAFVPGMGLEKSEYLGCCSYKSESDFKRDGYYTDMCNEARVRLMQYIADIKAIEVQS